MASRILPPTYVKMYIILITPVSVSFSFSCSSSIFKISSSSPIYWDPINPCVFIISVSCFSFFTLFTSHFHFSSSFLLFTLTFTLLSFFLVCFSPCSSPSLYLPWLTSVVQFCISVLLNIQPIHPLSHNFFNAQTTIPTFPLPLSFLLFSSSLLSFSPVVYLFPTSVCLLLDSSIQQPQHSLGPLFLSLFLST